MKERSKIFLMMMTAVLLALGSCTKDLPVMEPVGPGTYGEGPERIISASFGPASKSTLNADGVTPQFADGDQIMVANGTTVPQVCTVRVSGNQASFRTFLSGPLTAVYPKDAAVVSGNNITGIKVPSTQTGLFKDANIAKAVNVTDHAVFDNQTAVLRFYVDASIGVKSITVTSSSGDIATGATSIAVDSDETLISAKTAGNPDPRLCYVAVLPDNTTPKTLIFTSVTTTQETVTRTTTATLETNGIYNAFIPYYISIKVGSSPDVYQKWGYCNVGAFLPEEAGRYFAWGETTGQVPNGTTFNPGFSWSNCPHTDGTYSDANKAVFTKYTADKNAYAKSGTADGKTVLDLDDDAASVNWGPEWRMPTGGTGGEFGVLITGNDKGWITYYGVKGRKFADIDNESNYVFFPAAGLGNGTSYSQAGDGVRYWASTLATTNNPNNALGLGCGGTAYDINPVNEPYNRFLGRCVRPVYIQDIGSEFDTYTDEGNI